MQESAHINERLKLNRFLSFKLAAPSVFQMSSTQIKAQIGHKVDQLPYIILEELGGSKVVRSTLLSHETLSSDPSSTQETNRHCLWAAVISALRKAKAEDCWCLLDAGPTGRKKQKNKDQKHLRVAAIRERPCLKGIQNSHP